jgi:hypothetical protein
LRLAGTPSHLLDNHTTEAVADEYQRPSREVLLLALVKKPAEELLRVISHHPKKAVDGGIVGPGKNTSLG